ncbi:MAG TPA: phosphate ABC transporter substrate-binding protein PstS [Polyangiaceae bacterium]|nr:phosphate ABC transporter substrate-binding protein PstS [Polyangiaceae bacterium]
MFGRRLFIAFGLLAAIGCSKSSPTTDAQGSAATAPAPAAAQDISLNGAGATFPYPLYSKWMAEYNKLHTNVRINYQSIGSGGGIRQISAGTVDFGASDAPMKDEEAKGATGKLLHIPTTIGSVVVSYNLEGVTTPLKLTPEVLSGIFLGDIKKWNDKRLAEVNAGVALPNKDISVVYRTDGSGTTHVFTEYLAAVSPGWKEKVGAGKSVKWPVGLGAKGNEGVTGQLKSTPGTIGYVELAYANQSKLPKAELKNRAGNFIAPSPEAATAAAEGLDMPDSLHGSLADAAGDKSYPLASYTYMLVYEDAKDPVKGAALARFLWWATHEGQKHAAELDYAPLPAKVITKIEERLRGLRAGDKKLLDGV